MRLTGTAASDASKITADKRTTITAVGKAARYDIATHDETYQLSFCTRSFRV